MKSTIILIIAFAATIYSLNAQKVIDRNMDFTGKKSLKLNIQFADSVKIHTWNKQEVFAKAFININDNVDNEIYKVDFKETSDNIIVNASFDEDFFRNKEDNCFRDNIVWEFYIPDNTPFFIETISGNIIIDGLTTEIKAKTIGGFIDWTITPGQKADLELKTISGAFYSNIEGLSGVKRNSFSPVLIDKLNNGGFPVKLETISGNIYCRKQ